MSGTPRDQREAWNEVGRHLGELGRLLREQLSPDPTPTRTGPATGSSPAPATPPPTDHVPTPPSAGEPADNDGDAWASATTGAGDRPGWTPPAPPPTGPAPGAPGTPAVPGAPNPAGGPGAGQEWAGRAGWSDAAGPGAPSDWTGRPGRGRGSGASGADWDAARESVRQLGRSAQRLAAQAGEAARDPELRDSAARAARTVGDAATTAVRTWVTDLRERMRTPRWSAPDHPPERPPVSRLDDDPPP